MNPRQKILPLDEKVDMGNPWKRDGEVLPHDPTLTRMENTVRYMRKCDCYMPPNPWPEAMMLFGLDDKGHLCAAWFMPLGQFESIPEKKLFEIINPNTHSIFFIPAVTFPPTQEEAQRQIQMWLKQTTPDEFTKTCIYLRANGWYLDKSEVK